MNNPTPPIEPLLQLAKSGRMPLEALISHAEACKAAGRPVDALNLYKIWIACTPSDAKFVAFFNWGVLLADQNDLESAELAYRQALKLKPSLHQARINLGLALERKGQSRDALQLWAEVEDSKDAASAEIRCVALNSIGRLQEQLKQYDAAEAALTHSLAINPNQPDALQHWVHLRQKQCKWPVYSPLPGLTENAMLAATSPLAMLSQHDDPALQWHVANSFNQRKFNLQTQNLAGAARYGHQRIRLGYLSGDLCTQAVGLLMADLMEAHDKTQFEVFAFDFSPTDGTAYQHRLRGAFEHFISIKNLSDAQAAKLILDNEIDVLIDLHGLSSGARPGILAQRPAPLQVTYLGFIGTTAMPWIDYVISDAYALPNALQPYFTEKVIEVPSPFIPLHGESIPKSKQTRKTLGLPSDAIVLACFNNIYKINPEIFASWMKVLKRNASCVLWLLDDNPWATAQLQQRAKEAGAPLSRIVFAPRCTYAEYRSRLTLADLYLDTYPYNAGSTARDVFDARLPMVTLSGKTFVSRMAGSMLHAAGLDELCTSSHAEYERAINQLVRQPAQLKGLKKHLQQASSEWSECPKRLIASLEASFKRLLSH